MKTEVAFLGIPVLVGVMAGAIMAVGLSDNDGIQTMQDGIHGQIQDYTYGPGAKSALTPAILISGGSPAMGDPDAPITIVEWGDYQCTYCYLFHNATMQHIADAYIEKGIAKVVFRDFPLNGPDSALAAEASWCASDQSRYWEYHDMLYGNWGGEKTGWITAEALDSFARSAGLDAKEFEECMNTAKYRDSVAASYTDGQHLGIDATPSFMIFDDRNVIKIRGNQPLEVFTGSIEALLQE